MTFAIRNATRGSTIATQAEAARTFAQNLRGLMFRGALPAGGGMVLHGTNWIHTFWMRFALDCIYIDKRRVVVGMERALPPNRFGRPFFRASAVIELPSGAIEASATQIGDRIEIDEHLSG